MKAAKTDVAYEAIVAPLKRMDITNGEWAECLSIAGFLSWMRESKIAPPESPKELGEFLARYVRYRRAEQRKAFAHV